MAKPIIACVNGDAYGGAVEILLNCDIVISSEDASFALPEVKRGVIAAQGGKLTSCGACMIEPLSHMLSPLVIPRLLTSSGRQVCIYPLLHFCNKRSHDGSCRET